MTIVAYDNSGLVATLDTSTVSMVCSFAATPGAVLLVGLSTKASTDISAVWVNGTQLTRLGVCLNDGGLCQAFIYGLTAPPSGVLSISANIVGAVAANMCLGGITYTGARGVDPFSATIPLSAGAVANAAISISCGPSDMAFLMAYGLNNFTAVNATTRLAASSHGGYRMCDAAGATGAGGAVSISASCVNTSQNLAWLGLNIVASASGASTCFMCLSGVGN